MLDRADGVLKLAVAVAALMIGCAVGYYYVIFLPSQAAASIQRDAAAANAKIAAQLALKEEYNECMAHAFNIYEDRWQLGCKREHDRNPKIKIEGCALPAVMANAYDKSLKEDYRQCLDAFKAGS